MCSTIALLLTGGIAAIMKSRFVPDMLQIPWVSLTSSKKVIAGPAAERADAESERSAPVRRIDLRMERNGSR
jgi:hypothetical protein